MDIQWLLISFLKATGLLVGIGAFVCLCALLSVITGIPIGLWGLGLSAMGALTYLFYEGV